MKAFSRDGKREFDALFITFQPRRAVQKTQLVELVLGTIFSEKTGPEKDTQLEK